MPAAFGVNYLLQFLIECCLIPQLLNNKNLKADIHPICPMLYFSQPIGICGFKGSTFVIY